MRESELSADAAEKGEFPHYMLKEIHEQPRAVAQTLEERVADGKLLEAAFGPAAQAVFAQDRSGAHRRLRHQLSRGVGRAVLHRADLPPAVLGRDRERVPLPQPGGAEEHAVRERLAVGRDRRHARGAALAKQAGYLSQLAICNVPESSLVRESELVMLTRAGPEIGVASTKAFTTQLAALGMLVVALAKFHGADAERERGLVHRLLGIPALIEKTLAARPARSASWRSASPTSTTRCSSAAAPMYPIAMEGALKLKEISYIHAEAYAAGELKHGPLALVDADMPVIAVAPNNDLLEKLKSNLQEVRARGGELYVFADPESGIESVGRRAP